MRWLEPEITVAAASEPITVPYVKAHLRVDDSESDTLIAGYLAAARAYVEQYTGLKLYTQTVKLRAWALDSDSLLLPMAPVQSISGITYVDSAGATQTLSTDVYSTALYGLSPIVSLKYGQSWPSHREGAGNIVVTAVAGYADGTIPDPIKAAVLLLVGDFFHQRESFAAGQSVSAAIAAPVESLLANYRRTDA